MGQRVGKPKALLETEDRLYLDIALENCSLCDAVIVVTNEITQAFCEDNRCNIMTVQNHQPESGMIGSIMCGIKALSRSEAYLIYPVDYPLVRSSTIEKMLQVLQEKACFNYIVPLFRGRKGHPVLISEEIAKLVLKGDNLSLNTILKDFIPTYCETDDPGVVRNVNTYEDLPSQ